MRFIVFGAYDPRYPRNAVLRRGLAALGDEVIEVRAPGHLKAWVRYPVLAFAAARRVRLDRTPTVFLVPEFCQKDVPLARLLARATRRPLVFDPLASRYETKILDWRRRPPSSLRAWWNFRIDLAAFGGRGLVLADTEAHRRFYVRGYGIPSGRVAVLPVGYDDSLFDPDRYEGGGRTGRDEREAAAGRPFTVLFSGSFLPLHGAEAVVEAARIVAARDAAGNNSGGLAGAGVRFRFVGSGQTLSRVRELAERYGLTNCDFAGWQPYARIPGEIAACDIALGVFGRTGKARRVVPHKVFQALGMGKPVITARTPAAEEFFRDGVDLRLCDEPYPESLAAAVLELRADPELRSRLGASGLKLARERFASKPTAQRLKDILEANSGHNTITGKSAGNCIVSRIRLDLDTPEFRNALSGIRRLAYGPAAHVLLDARNRIVALPLPADGSRFIDAVAKEFRPSGLKRLKTLVVPSKAIKAWRGAVACVDRDVSTPRPMACLERRRAGVVAESWFVSAWVENAREIRHLFLELEGDDLRVLVSGLAAYLRRAHERGILHGDLSDGNILVSGPPPYRFFLIDTNRIRARRRLSWRSRIRNLVRLGVPPDAQDAFLDAYLAERRGSTGLRRLYRRAKKRYAANVALKKKLRLRRLAERLKIQ
jgi:glycosyltransferase involved in cell wall biosynthesis